MPGKAKKYQNPAGPLPDGLGPLMSNMNNINLGNIGQRLMSGVGTNNGSAGPQDFGAGLLSGMQNPQSGGGLNQLANNVFGGQFTIDKTSAANMANNMTANLGSRIDASYQRNQAGRYNLNDAGVNQTGMAISSGIKGVSSKMSNSMIGKTQLEGVGDIAQGLSTKSYGADVGKEGVIQKRYDGTGAGKVIGGATKVGLTTGLNVLGVPPELANAVGGAAGNVVGTVSSVLTDKDEKRKRKIESNRLDGVYSSIAQDKAGDEMMEKYATLMPHYDKNSNQRYAQKGAKIKSRHQKGGKIMKFFRGGAVILGGQLHKEGNDNLGKGNPIYQNGAKVAETEREELLLNKEQTNNVEKHVKFYEQTKDPVHFRHLGMLMKEIVLNQTEDKSGKFKGVING